MSDILIRGMEMPNGNAKITIEISADGLVIERETGSGNRYLGPRIFRAVQIRDHGDLIDREILGKFKELVTTDVPGGKLTREYVPMAAVRNLVVAIPASE